MKNLISSLFVGAALMAFTSCGDGSSAVKPYNEGINIIPMPQTLVQQDGQFKLADGMVIGASTPEAKTVAEFFADKMMRSTGYKFTVADKGTINLTIDASKEGNDEAYELNVAADGVNVSAKTPQGLFYGMQTFLQLLPAEIESPEKVKGISWTAAAVSVKDEPRFHYRGLMIDPCRHFMPVEAIKKQIDVMAMFKINTLHWHLTEDQGWRIEIKKYPKLTEVGSKRIDGEGTEYGGFYTQEEVKDIVKYAADRFITVVPELEIPGHELAAIAAYPELSCKGEAITPRVIWGVEDIVMCPGKEEVFKFLEDVIDELVALFPSEYFHIGGDECPKASWKQCPLCQKRITQEGLRGDKKHSPEERLQSYVVRRIEKYLATKGKKIIGWDEILEGGVDPTATIMSWRGETGGIAAASAGHDVIMTPGSGGMYLDHYQGDYKIEPVAIGGYATLEKTYSYNPVPDTLVVQGKEKYVKGVQANVWSEYLYTEDIRSTMTFPRGIALAEIAWTNLDRKDYKDFERRINNAYVRLDEHDVKYHIPLPHQPKGSYDYVAFTDKASLEFTTTRPCKMVYTTDGNEPTAKSTEYTAPINFDDSGVLKIASVLPSGKMSKVRTITVEKQELAPAATVEKTEPGLVMKVTDGMYLDMKAFDTAGKEPIETKVIKDLKELKSYRKTSDSMRGIPQYASVAEGYFNVPEDGVYVLSSEYENVWVDGKLVIDNGGEVKRFSRRDRGVALQKGLHQLKVVFLGHIVGGWPSNWSDGVVRYRNVNADEFTPISADMLVH